MKILLLCIFLCFFNFSHAQEKIFQENIPIENGREDLEELGLLLDASLLNKSDSLRGNVTFSVSASNLMEFPVSNIYVEFARSGSLETRVPVAWFSKDELITRYNFAISLDDIKHAKIGFNLFYPEEFDQRKHYYILNAIVMAKLGACDDVRLREELVLNGYEHNSTICKQTYDEASRRFSELLQKRGMATGQMDWLKKE